MVRRLVSEGQLSLLLDLLEGDKDLALGRLAGMPMGHADVTNRWAGIAQTLNCLGEGATKSGPEWKTYWHEQKYKARKRAMDVRQHASGTGGGRAKKPLKELELRIISLIGQVAVYGNAEVRLPFNDPLLPATSVDELTSGTAMTTSQIDSVMAVPEVLLDGQGYTNTSSAPPQYSLAPEPTEEFAGPSGSSPTARRAGQRRRRRYARAVAAAPPQWAQDFEERRLDVDTQTSAAIVSIAESLKEIRTLLAEVVRVRM